MGEKRGKIEKYYIINWSKGEREEIEEEDDEVLINNNAF